MSGEALRALVEKMRESGRKATEQVSRPDVPSNTVPLTAALVYHLCADSLEAALNAELPGGQK